MQFEPPSQHNSHEEGQNFFNHASSLLPTFPLHCPGFETRLLHLFISGRASRHVPGIEKHGNLYKNLSGMGIGDSILALIRAFSSWEGLTHP